MITCEQMEKAKSREWNRTYRRKHRKEISKRSIEWRRKWRKEHPELAKEKDKVRYLRERIKGTPHSKKHYEAHKNEKWFKGMRNKRSNVYYYSNLGKARCRRKLRYAVNLGNIKVPDKCSLCGAIKKVEGHHDDYNKPYEVKWLCKSCHYIVDKKQRLAEDIKKYLLEHPINTRADEDIAILAKKMLNIGEVIRTTMLKICHEDKSIDMLRDSATDRLALAITQHLKGER